MRKEKRTISIFVFQVFFLLFCFVILPGTLYLIGHFRFTVQKSYENTWNISLPDKMELLYDEHTPQSFHGDGIRHTVYRLERERINLRFIVADDPEVSSFCMEICDDLETEESYLPDFEEEHMWIRYEKQSQSDTMIMVYFPEAQHLHFFQKLI